MYVCMYVYIYIYICKALLARLQLGFHVSKTWVLALSVFTQHCKVQKDFLTSGKAAISIPVCRHEYYTTNLWLIHIHCFGISQLLDPRISHPKGKPTQRAAHASQGSTTTVEPLSPEHRYTGQTLDRAILQGLGLQGSSHNSPIRGLGQRRI